MRLDKFLSTSGIGTRSEVKKCIKKGMVKVNNEIIKDDGYVIDENVDRVIFNNQEVTYQKYHYYMLNKPAGYVTSTKDKEVTVMSLIKEFPKFKLSPVGRLDKDTEGLLIITDDGELIHELTSPKKHIPKTYYVETLESITNNDVKMLEEGVTLDDGYQTLPSEIIQKNDRIIYLTIYEGKYHQVKRMLEAINNKVTYLKRVKMNNLELDENLKKGEYRKLSNDELKQLTKS